jgi:hypothetical protein
VKPKASVFMYVGFFLLFPAAGLVWFWKDAHDRVRSSAVPIGRDLVTGVLSTWDPKTLTDEWTADLRASEAPQMIGHWKTRYGKLLKLGPLEATKSWAGAKEADGQVWQFVEIGGQADFERAYAVPVRARIARRTLSPEWRLDALQVGTLRR